MNNPAADVAAAMRLAREAAGNATRSGAAGSGAAGRGDADTADSPASSSPASNVAAARYDALLGPGTSARAFSEFCTAGLWPGVGPTTIEHLNVAGIDAPGKVTEKALAALPNITVKRARKLFTAWVGVQSLYELVQILVAQDLPVVWARRLADGLGEDAAGALAADPWQLLLVTQATVAQADRLARRIQPDVRGDDPRRAAALIAWVLARHARSGHTASPAPMVGAELRAYGFRGAAEQQAAIEFAVSAGVVRRVADPESGEAGKNDWIAADALAEAEECVARHLGRLASAAERLVPDSAAHAAASGLDATQRSAVERAARHGVSLLTGGPGTGKSRTVISVVDMCRRAGRTVALAAPTGRAAKRLSELLAEADKERAGDTADDATDGAADSAADTDSAATDSIDDEAGDGAVDATDDSGEPSAEAMTIHRLLGARPLTGGRGSLFEHDESDPIDADMVVIDEASMLDAELAAALLRAVPDAAHVLFVGDPAQLPSIGAGRVLGDVLRANAFPTTELTTLYRHAQGGEIARLATAVRGGDLVRPDSVDHEVAVVPAVDSEAAAARVKQLVTDAIPRVFGVSGGQVQVVTPIHRGPAGTKELNRMLKAELNPGPHRGRAVRGFHVGDRVVATANYLAARPTGYANGEIGTVVNTANNAVTVAFPGGEAEISGKALGDLVHGWAVTVHRAQGSEWEAVVVVVPAEVGGMLSRPLVYTALTRARTHLSVVTAAGPGLARAVRHVGARPRRTRLAALLTGSGDRRAQQ